MVLRSSLSSVLRVALLCGCVCCSAPAISQYQEDDKPAHIQVPHSLYTFEHGMIRVEKDTLFKGRPRTVEMRAVHEYHFFTEAELENWKAWPDSLFKEDEGYTIGLDDTGRLTKISLPHRLWFSSISYNAHGVEYVSDPMSSGRKTTLYTYSPDGRLLKSEENENGFVTGRTEYHYERDLLKRITERRSMSPDTTIWHFSYDSAGDLTRAEQHVGILEMTEEIHHRGPSYDSTISRTGLRTDHPMARMYAVYDSTASSVVITDTHTRVNVHGPNGMTTERTYGKNGDVRTTIRQHGRALRSISPWWEETYSYNEHGHLKGIRTTIDDRVHVTSFHYLYDARGNPVRIVAIDTETARGHSFSKYKEAWSFSYTYW